MGLTFVIQLGCFCVDYQLLEQKKLFETMQTLSLVHIMLTQLQNAERVNSVWDVRMEHGLKDDNKNHFQDSFSPGNKDSDYQPSTCLSSMPYHHHRVIM